MPVESCQYFIIKSPAKINLFLKIIGKTDDDYHDLESILCFLDLHDEILIKLSLKKNNKPTIDVTFTGDDQSKIDKNNNIINQIFYFFQEKYALNQNLKVKIIKNIPIGGGLGGGSSNGAMFMIFLNKVFKLNLTKEELQNISFNFGSDLAFFLEEKSSIIRSRGIVSSNINCFNDIPILLVNPKIHISTKLIFDNFNKRYYHKTSNHDLLERDVLSIIKNEPNQLEEIAVKYEPKIAELINFLKNQNAITTKMSGSGSSCFAIFDNKKNLDKAFKDCLDNFPNYFIKKTTLLYRNLPLIQNTSIEN